MPIMEGNKQNPDNPIPQTMDKSQGRLFFLTSELFMKQGDRENGGDREITIAQNKRESQFKMSKWKKYVTYGWSCDRTKPLRNLFSNLTVSSDTKVLRYIRQDPTEKHRGRSCLSLTLIVLILAILTFGCVTAILWSVYPSRFGKVFANIQDGRKPGAGKNDTATAHDRMSRCKDSLTMMRLTKRQCGGILRLNSGNSNSSMCKSVPSLIRCVYVTMWYKDKPCSIEDVTDAVLKNVSQTYPNPPAPIRVCQGIGNDFSFTDGIQPSSCEAASGLYKMGRRYCSAIVNTIEGEGAKGKAICRNLMSLFKCVKAAIADHQLSCPREVFRSTVKFATVMFPYLTNESLARCKGNRSYPPCTGYLNEQETEAFVRCSKYLSLQSVSMSSTPHCKIYAYMARCIKGELTKIGRLCPLQNIVRRLENTPYKVPEVSPHHIRTCSSFIEDYDQTNMCEEEDVLTMVAEDFCSKPDNEPFRLTKTERTMSELFEQCSNISATVTCVSEYLTTTGISCHPAQVEATIIQHGGISALNGDEFNYTDCTGVAAVKDRLCSDSLSILQITGSTCNIALDFIKHEITDNFKCSYFRQFVTCVQTLLQPRGYECFFNQLEATLISEHKQFVQRTGFDPSYCSDSAANL